MKSFFAYNPSCPYCGDFMEGDGYSVVLHCPNTQSDYSSLEPDALPVYCYLDSDSVNHDDTENCDRGV